MDLVVPELEATAAVFAGSSLRGDAGPGEELDADPARALRVRVRIVALERMPAVSWTPLSSRSRFVADLLGTDPLVGTPELLAGARFATGDEATGALERWDAGEAGRTVEVAALDETLPLGATAALGLLGAEQVENPLDWLDEVPDGEPVRKAVQVLVGNAAAGPGVAFLIEDVQPGWWRPVEEEQDVASALAAAQSAEAGDDAAAAEPEPAPAPPDARRVLRREIVLLDVAPRPGEGPLLVLVPRIYRKGEVEAFACVVTVDAPADDAEALAALAERLGALRAAGEERARSEPYTEAQLTALRRTSALEALATPGTRREALLFYAQGLGTPLADDLALAGTDALLGAYAAAVLAAFDELDEPALALLADDAALAWHFESAAYRLLADRASRGELEPELAALLVRHAGEAGRFPGSIEDAIAAARGVPDLERRFAEENRIFLEDSSPAARVRAYDWLELRGEAPAGYDPLADRDARRAALRALEDAEAETEEPR